MISKRFIIAAIFCCCNFIGVAQKRNYVWCFGDSAGIDFNNLGNPSVFPTAVDSRGSCASISDSDGNLLFYASNPYPPLYNGGVIRTGVVFSKNHLLMQNGDTIVGRGWYNEQLIIPIPDSSNLFYLFSAGVTSIYGLYYSLVDLNQNGGLGSVTQKNIQLQSFQNVDCLNAIKHGNGRDWWVFFRRWNGGTSSNNEFHSYLITPTGVTNYTVQNVGSPSYTGLGKLTFSAQGNRLAFVTYAGLLELYDFDRCTGITSNPVNIFQETSIPPYNHFFGCEFSPSGNILYVTITDQTSYLFQFDLTAANIAASIDTLWQTSFPTEAIGELKRGPDGKIYESGPYTNPAVFIYPYPDSMYNVYNMNLGVINSPNNLGAASDFQPYSFYLGGKRTYWGLPNNPDYDLGASAGNPCGVGVSEMQQETPNAELVVSYIGGWQKLFINAQNIKGRNCQLKIFAMDGREVFSSAKKTLPPYFTMDVDVSNLASGLYVVRLVTEREVLSGKFLLH